MVIIQIVIAIALIGVILLQQQGSGLGAGWGGGGASYHTRQGLEKLLFRLTILLVVVFVGLSVWALL